MLIGIFNPMGAQSDRLRCEVCQNLFLSPMNTGLLRPAVATALTVYGIETYYTFITESSFKDSCNSTYRLRYWNFWSHFCNNDSSTMVATALTVYGIETRQIWNIIILTNSCNSTYRLQYWNCNFLESGFRILVGLQQYLPFTVLKQLWKPFSGWGICWVATAFTVYDIETYHSCSIFISHTIVAIALTVYRILIEPLFLVWYIDRAISLMLMVLFLLFMV